MLIDEENHTYEDIIATAYLISHEVSHQVIKILIINDNSHSNLIYRELNFSNSFFLK